MKFYRSNDEERSLCQKCFDDLEVKKTNDDFKINRDDYKEHELGQRESILCHGLRYGSSRYDSLRSDGLRYDGPGYDGLRCSERHSVDTCDGCKFYDSVSKEKGTCRLNPPVFNVNADRFRWPKVNWTDWCWQFKTRGDP